MNSHIHADQAVLFPQKTGLAASRSSLPPDAIAGFEGLRTRFSFPTTFEFRSRVLGSKFNTHYNWCVSRVYMLV